MHDVSCEDFSLENAKYVCKYLPSNMHIPRQNSHLEHLLLVFVCHLRMLGSTGGVIILLEIHMMLCVGPFLTCELDTLDTDLMYHSEGCKGFSQI